MYLNSWIPVEIVRIVVVLLRSRVVVDRLIEAVVIIGLMDGSVIVGLSECVVVLWLSCSSSVRVWLSNSVVVI